MTFTKPWAAYSHTGTTQFIETEDNSRTHHEGTVARNRHEGRRIIPRGKADIPFHPSDRQVRKAARLVTKMLDSSSALPTSSRDILHITTEFLSQCYKVTTLNCECLRRMEHEASKAVPTNVREDLVAPITCTECNLAVLHRAPNKSPGWNRISLEFYKTSLRMT
jgi:hypothetical protein